MTDIKPRYDDDGVPWCDVGCPTGEALTCYSRGVVICGVDDITRLGSDKASEMCPHAVKEMASKLSTMKHQYDFMHKSFGEAQEELRRIAAAIEAIDAAMAADELTRTAQEDGLYETEEE